MTHFILKLLTGSVIYSSAMAFDLKRPIIIFPGFGNNVDDYSNPLGRGTSYGFVSVLKSRGIQSSVVPINRSDWLSILLSLTDQRFWNFTCKPEDLYGFYFRKAHDEITRVIEETGQKPLIIGHSAGGWLARGMMSDGIWKSGYKTKGSLVRNENNYPGEFLNTSAMISGLITLGTPHIPPFERKFDMTRGALCHVHENYPGALLKGQGIPYASVAGRSIIADETASRSSVQSVAFRSYQQVLGKQSQQEIHHLPGDGVVPLQSSHLDGALQITLDSVYHSISTPDLNNPELEWYGSESVVDSWLDQLSSVQSKI